MHVASAAVRTFGHRSLCVTSPTPRTGAECRLAATQRTGTCGREFHRTSAAHWPLIVAGSCSMSERRRPAPVDVPRAATRRARAREPCRGRANPFGPMQNAVRFCVMHDWSVLTEGCRGPTVFDRRTAAALSEERIEHLTVGRSGLSVHGGVPDPPPGLAATPDDGVKHGAFTLTRRQEPATALRLRARQGRRLARGTLAGVRFSRRVGRTLCGHAWRCTSACSTALSGRRSQVPANA